MRTKGFLSARLLKYAKPDIVDGTISKDVAIGGNSSISFAAYDL